jgi:ATP-dependent helicase HrpB
LPARRADVTRGARPSKLAALMRVRLPDLPIVAALPALLEALARGRRIVVEAPPGAGKSTLVPLAMLETPWLGDGRILMLEPRRVATRAVAARMAALLHEPLGATVGFRTRLERRVGPQTRIEVITEGILTRMLQDDAALEGTACVIFDEFHERSLQADLGLALCLDSQRHLREDLRLIVMSATLDGARLERLLGDSQTVSASGRSYEVTTRFVAPPSGTNPGADELESRVCNATVAALEAHDGDALVFLPGGREVRRTVERLAARLPDDIDIVPLYGELGAAAQDQALQPSAPGRRRVIVATNIAETSLTIEGVRIVIDGGFERRPRFDPATGMSRLDTVRISRASADQRRGRAGRMGTGLCVRLWSESVHETLPAHAPAEILEADLAPLALELALWGCPDPAGLRWLDAPPSSTWSQAHTLLRELHAINDGDRITVHGRRMARLGVHPRLSHMIVRGEELGLASLAVRIAALLSERDAVRAARERDPDLRTRLDLLDGAGRASVAIDESALSQVRRACEQIERRRRESADRQRHEHGTAAPAADEAAGLLLAFAYPDRIGQARPDAPGVYLLSGGRGARFRDATALARSEFVVAATLDAGARDARIDLAAPLDRAMLERHLAHSISTHDVVEWDPRAGAVIAQRERRLGALIIGRAALADGSADAVLREMLKGVRTLGIDALPWTSELRAWRSRVQWLRSLDQGGTDEWPDLDDATLLATLEDWLAPWLDGVSRREHLARIDLSTALRSRLDRAQQRRLDELAPTHLTVPSGSRVAVDYSGTTPSISVRLQEVFGLMESPRLAGGRAPVTIELLSPARRPVQVTRDLASFWQRGYAEVRRELKGRYPKHYWPEDPHAATPTQRVRPK